MSGPPAAAHPLVHVLVQGAPADQAQVQIHGVGIWVWNQQRVQLMIRVGALAQVAVLGAILVQR